ncbi:MAG: PIN domain nuclease [Thermoprotei archaeon]|nr:MAG: PIN domain nuclease [Thermoprotei archaeon]
MKAFIDANFLVYLNTLRDRGVLSLFENFFEKLLTEYVLFTDILVLDEVLYVSKSKYKVPYPITIKFLNRLIPKYINIAPLTLKEYVKAVEIVEQYGLKPSDAIHAATCIINNIKYIVSEDQEFDKIKNIERIWIKT